MSAGATIWLVPRVIEKRATGIVQIRTDAEIVGWGEGAISAARNSRDAIASTV